MPTSADYDWAERSKASTEAEWNEAVLVNAMWDIHHNHDDTDGSSRMTNELKRRDRQVNHTRTECLMVENGLYARDGRRRKVRTTIPDITAPPLPDLLGRDSTPGEPAQRTCGNITYIPTARADSISPTSSISV